MKLIIDITDEQVCRDIVNGNLEPQTETDKVIIDALYRCKLYEERPQGKWIKAQGEWVTDTVYKICFKCSECGCHFNYPFNFCPNCGAQMVRGNADE